MDQNHGLTPLEKLNFSTFWTSCFYSLERRVFALEYGKRHFPGLYGRKKKVGRMSIVRPIPFNKFHKKMSIFRLFEPFFYSLKRCFFVLEYRKRRFPGLYCLKKKVGKMAIFRPKPWINPFEKMSIFRVFCTCFFHSL